jgi:tetratricopeptide (TPR) repeat protein
MKEKLWLIAWYLKDLYGLLVKAPILEKRVERNPHDVASRTKLLECYSFIYFEHEPSREHKREHILWLIENEPKAEALDASWGHLLAESDAEAYSKAKALWLRHIENEPENLAILNNSGKFFLLHDRELAEQSLLKIRSLDPKNYEWSLELGFLNYLHLRKMSGADRKDAAQEALGHFERACDLFPEEEKAAMFLFFRSCFAQTAMEAGETEKAREYAEEMLNCDVKDPMYGHNFHHGNLILGRIALQAGDFVTAKERLVNAGTIPLPPRRYLFLDEPNVTLAKELLEKGEKESVLEYFELCSRFWKRHRSELNEWAATVRAGGIPCFDAQCSCQLH